MAPSSRLDPGLRACGPGEWAVSWWWGRPAWPISNGTGQLIRLSPGLMSGYRFLGLSGVPPAG
jgi:hypothetical protein